MVSSVRMTRFGGGPIRSERQRAEQSVPDSIQWITGFGLEMSELARGRESDMGFNHVSRRLRRPHLMAFQRAGSPTIGRAE